MLWRSDTGFWSSAVSAVEAVISIAIVEGEIDTLQSGRTTMPDHIISMCCLSSTQLGTVASVFTSLSGSDSWLFLGLV